MNVFLYTLIVFLIVDPIKGLTKENKIDWSFPDIKKAVIEESQYDLRAFKSTLNDELIRSKKYTHLIWYAIGNVELVSNGIEFDSNGFSIKLSYLTNENKQLLIQEIKNVYDIDANLSQIFNLELDSVECEIEVRDENDHDYSDLIIGNVKQFNKYPLNVYFKADKHLKSRYMLMKVINQSNEPVRIKCDLSSGDLFKETFEINYLRKDIVFVKQPKIVQKYDENLQDMKQSLDKLVEKQNKIVSDFEKINQRFELIEKDKNSEVLVENIKENIEKRLVDLIKSVKTNQVSDKLKEHIQELEDTVEKLKAQEKEINTRIEKLKQNSGSNKLEISNLIEKLNETLSANLSQVLTESQKTIDKLEEEVKKNYDLILEKIQNLETNLAKFQKKKKKTKNFGGNFDRDLGKHSKSVFQVIEISDSFIASGSTDKTIKVWNIDEDELVFTLNGHTATVSTLTSIGNKYLVSGSKDKTIKIWDLELNASLVTTLNNHGNEISFLQKLANGLMASGDNNGRILIWDTSSFTFLRELKNQGNAHSDSVDYMIEMPNGFLASAGSDQLIKIWDVSTGALKITLKGHTSTINSLGLSQNGQLLSVSSDGKFCIWTIDFGKNSYSLTYYTYNYSKLMALVVFQNGNIAIGSDNSKIYYIINNNGNYGTTKYILEGHTDSIYSLALLSSGELVSASRDGSIKIWN